MMLLGEDNEEHSDEELAVSARRDPAAFGVLMQRYQERLLRYIMRSSAVVRDGAEDILQESFLKAYQNINNFDPELSFSSWMYRIVHNTTISHWRKSHARPEGHNVQVDESFFTHVRDDADLIRDIDLGFLREHIDAILATMDPKYRDVLVLAFLEEKSYREISDIIKKPMGTIAARVSRAKKKFLIAYKDLYDHSIIS